MQIRVNGTSTETQADTIAGLIENLSFAPSQVAVEKNGELIRRGAWPETSLESGDAIEVVTLVGGG